LLNPQMTKCLMVRSWKGNSWTFPKGKINQDESEIDCAKREVKEEVGFDISNLIQPHEHLQVTLQNGKSITLYIVPNVPESYPFRTETRFEISEIRWIPVKALPKSSSMNRPSDNSQLNFWMVAPFCKRLLRWIRDAAPQLQPSPQSSPSLPQNNSFLTFDPSNSVDRTTSSPTRFVNAPDKRFRHRNSKIEQRSGKPNDQITFGDVPRWTPEQMFADNERLFGVRSTAFDEAAIKPVRYSSFPAPPSSPDSTKAHFSFDLDDVLSPFNAICSRSSV